MEKKWNFLKSIVRNVDKCKNCL